MTCMALPNGNFKVAVHIADVSHFVQPQSHLDKEALRRGTSVYLVDDVINMLPEMLSEGTYTRCDTALRRRRLV